MAAREGMTQAGEARLAAWLLSPTAEGPLLVVGETAAAVLFAQQLAACQAPAAGRACGACRGCQGTPTGDGVLIDPETATIGIALIRDLHARVALLPLGLRRLVVLERAERLTLAAANALLKLLEDAPATTRLLLTARLPGRLLPTILSRCARLRLPRSITAAAPPQLPRAGGLELLAAVEEISEAEITAIGDFLLAQARQQPGPALKRALLRLRDYHRLSAQRGNVRLAKEVLLASLLPFAHS